MMNILFLSHYFPPEGNAPAARVYEMTRRWARAGDKVSVLTCEPNVPAGRIYPGYRNRLITREEMEGVEVIRVWTYIAPNRGVFRRSLNYLSYMFSAVPTGLRLPRPDVIVATSPQFFSGVAGSVVTRLRGIPFVLEIRDIWPESIAAVGAVRGRRVLRILERWERGLYAAADRIVTVGEGYRRRLVEHGAEPGKIEVIPNGVDTSRFSLAAVGTAPTSRRRFVCAYVGTVGMACGLDVVLDAAEMLRSRGDPDVLFLIAGEGARREELMKRAQQAGLDNVRFLGRVAREKVPKLLAEVDACLVHLIDRPLFRTVLPSKMFEAAAMERPIILGVEGEAAGWVKSADAGLCIPPGDAAALVRAVDTLRNDRELARRLGRSGRAAVERWHDYDRLADRYRGLLESLVEMG